MRLVADAIVRHEPDGGAVFSGTALTRYREGDTEVLLCAYRTGSAKVSADGRIEMRESRDGGTTWMPVPSPLDADRGSALAPPAGETQLAGPHLGSDSRGTVILVAARMHVVPEGHADYDAQAAGIVDAECVMVRWSDGAWGEPVIVDARRTPDEWAIPCGPPVSLGGGRWLAPAERHAKTHVPEWLRGYHALELLSDDDGRTWRVAGPMLNDPDREVVYYDQHVARLESGRLLSLAWVHDVIDDVTLTARSGVSDDDGASWIGPADTPLQGGPAAPVALGAGRVVASYPHRSAPAGVRVCLSHDDGETWDLDTEFVVWDETERAITGAPASAPLPADRPEPLWDTMWSWSFGLPTTTALDDGSVGVAFYATEPDGARVVRFARVAP